MPANVKSMMFKGNIPWHGIGKDVNHLDTIKSQDALEFAGANYEVEKAPLFTIDMVNDKPDLRNVPDLFAIRNSKTKQIFGTCGNVWQPLQNKDALGWFDPFIESGMAHFHTVGVLGEGETMWALAKINTLSDEIQKNDFIERFILLSNRHQTGFSIPVGYTPIRVVCANTLAAAMQSNESSIIRVMHSQRIKESLVVVRDTMNLLNQTFEATIEQYRFLTSRFFKQKDVRRYVVKLFNLDEELNKSKISDLCNDVERLYATGKGKNISDSTPANWWNLYNAVNEYLNYEVGPRATKEKRLTSLWFGTGNNLNQKALSIATEFANAI